MLKTRRLIILIIVNFLFLVANCSLFFVQGFAQVKAETVELVKSEEIVEIINIGNNGFLIETVNTSNYKFRLLHYSTDLDKLWETPLNIFNARFTTSASSLSDYAYITNQTLQLDLKSKEIKKFEEKPIPPGRVLKADFQDNKYWYTLYYIKFNGEYLLRRVEHSNCKLKEMILDLPKLEDYKYSTEWCYLSNDNNNHIYLYQKTTGYQNNNRKLNNNINYKVMVLDTSMQIKDKININTELGNNYVYPSQNFKKEREFPSPALDYDIKTIRMKDIYFPKTEAYSSILYEPTEKSIYIYGLSGSIPYYEKDNRSVIDGFFIYKYDDQGKLISKILSKLPNDTTLYGGYDIKTLLTFTPDNKLVFQIYFDKIKYGLSVQGMVYSFVYFEDKPYNKYINKVASDLGKIDDPLIYDYVIKNLQHFDFILFSSNFSGAVKYYNSLSRSEQKNSIFRLYRYKTGNVLIEDNSRKFEINMMSFSK